MNGHIQWYSRCECTIIIIIWNFCTITVKSLIHGNNDLMNLLLKKTQFWSAKSPDFSAPWFLIYGVNDFEQFFRTDVHVLKHPPQGVQWHAFRDVSMYAVQKENPYYSQKLPWIFHRNMLIDMLSRYKNIFNVPKTYYRMSQNIDTFQSFIIIQSFNSRGSRLQVKN